MTKTHLTSVICWSRLGKPHRNHLYHLDLTRQEPSHTPNAPCTDSHQTSHVLENPKPRFQPEFDLLHHSNNRKLLGRIPLPAFLSLQSYPQHHGDTARRQARLSCPGRALVQNRLKAIGGHHPTRHFTEAWRETWVHLLCGGSEPKGTSKSGHVSLPLLISSPAAQKRYFTTSS